MINMNKKIKIFFFIIIMSLFTKNVYGNYDNFVKEQGDKIEGNRALALKLLDEYFDEFAEHHLKPSKHMMDNFGFYKLVDYEDCFGSFEKFQKAINPILEKINDHDT